MNDKIYIRGKDAALEKPIANILHKLIGLN